MKLAVMQPYLFPYIGYFQLVAAVDRFVFFDDVNYIKNGWINRNRWNIGGQPRYFTVPLRDASPFQPIHSVRLVDENGWRRKILESMRHAYRQARYYRPVSELVESVLATESPGIAEMAKTSVRSTARYLDLDAEFVNSSVPYRNEHLKGCERVLDICERECATSYFNLSGGRALYREAEFAARGVALQFVGPNLPQLRQDGANPIPGLSIIDVLMNNDVRDVRAAVGLIDVGSA